MFTALQADNEQGNYEALMLFPGELSARKGVFLNGTGATNITRKLSIVRFAVFISICEVSTRNGGGNFSSVQV
ncbi:hypothetical protein [Pantoea septica]|uniref:hypothetical protein n=1 Tax=Pantoea septica TaxID=472695 RepID=UPI00289E37B7|nr:hypothetical protein [Pantoea septica]